MNIKVILVFVLFAIAFSACSSKFEPRSESEMTTILLDMHLAESYSQHLLIDSNHIMRQDQDSLKLYYAQILKKHHLNEQEFMQNMKFYTANPEKINLIYERILEKVTVLQAESDTNLKKKQLTK